MNTMCLLLQADTTDVGYKIGYQVGSWLPFAVLLIITFFVVRFVRKKRKEENR